MEPTAKARGGFRKSEDELGVVFIKQPKVSPTSISHVRLVLHQVLLLLLLPLSFPHRRVGRLWPRYWLSIVLSMAERCSMKRHVSTTEIQWDSPLVLATYISWETVRRWFLEPVSKLNISSLNANVYVGCRPCQHLIHLSCRDLPCSTPTCFTGVESILFNQYVFMSFSC